MKSDIDLFFDLGASSVKYIDGQLVIEAPDDAIPAIMAALTPDVPIIP